ncbi:type I-E CRISPR-associated protein Cas6/Cse3/CasE [Lactiplantibacillus pentosus]|uniref:type I-E CRISPR-associated protein Cas6/Cse3/CasE n=1 Tax=Lactiplantibacillus pentosus TaxID=1589 RepID=UPI000D01314B|nr:type I-E CRISPR-associated protein Cas6/Cse3/CasE [Lactiplantibacillus pentosus]PRO86600.1 type I-E CRISPR-associated protein Cas6/Cse3/CasE [Lactiplantibacillus pentosus]
MYLSRVEIDRDNRYKTRDLTHLGAYHNWVEQSFPEEIENNQRGRHLWRIDRLNGKDYLLVLSADRPKLEQLEQYGVEETALTKSYDTWLDHIEAGMVLRFRLTANPTHSIIEPNHPKGRVVPHVTIEQQKQWLADRALRAGFALVARADTPADETEKLAFDVVSHDWPTLHRRKGRSVRLSRVTFEGVLRVQDADIFKQTLTKGLGREKAFGMGLMTVIPTE